MKTAIKGQKIPLGIPRLDNWREHGEGFSLLPETIAAANAALVQSRGPGAWSQQLPPSATSKARLNGMLNLAYHTPPVFHGATGKQRAWRHLGEVIYLVLYHQGLGHFPESYLRNMTIAEDGLRKGPDAHQLGKVERVSWLWCRIMLGWERYGVRVDCRTRTIDHYTPFHEDSNTWEPFSTYFGRIARRARYAYHGRNRAENERNTEFLEDYEEDDNGTGKAPTVEAAKPETVTEIDVKWEAVALSLSPADYRLYELEKQGFTYGEIGSRLGRSAHAVKQMWYRLVRKLESGKAGRRQTARRNGIVALTWKLGRCWSSSKAANQFGSK